MIQFPKHKRVFFAECSGLRIALQSFGGCGGAWFCQRKLLHPLAHDAFTEGVDEGEAPIPVVGDRGDAVEQRQRLLRADRLRRRRRLLHADPNRRMLCLIQREGAQAAPVPRGLYKGPPRRRGLGEKKENQRRPAAVTAEPFHLAI